MNAQSQTIQQNDLTYSHERHTMKNPVFLRVNNTMSKVEGLNEKDLKELRKILSYEKTTKVTWDGVWEKEKICLLNEDNSFPTGLLKEVREFFYLKDYFYKFVDMRQKPDPCVSFKARERDMFPLRPYQERAVDLALDMGRGVLELVTAAGKSRIIQELILRHKLYSLVVAPSTFIMDQLADGLREIFGKKAVATISGGRISGKDAQIFVACFASLKNMKQDFWEKIGLLIIDELHHAGANTYQELNEKCWGGIYHRYGLTGTNFRNDGTDIALRGVLSECLFQFGYHEALKGGYLTPVRFKVYNFAHSKVKPKYRSHIEENDHLLTKGVEYNNVIANMANTIEKTSGKAQLILVKEIEHGLKLQKMIHNSVFISGRDSAFVSREKLENYRNGKFNILIGTSILGEGVDLPRAEVVIMASVGKARSDIIQKIGRVLRLSEGKQRGTIIDFTHDNSFLLKKHSQKRVEIYKEFDGYVQYGSVPEKFYAPPSLF